MRCSLLSQLAVLLLGLVSTSLANNPPTSEIVWPDMNPGTWFGFRQEFFTRAQVSDSDGTVQNVEFYLNGVLLNGTTTTWVDQGKRFFEVLSLNRPAPGNYSLVARAYDDGGATTDSAPITLKVEPQAAPPAVSMGVSHVTSTSAEIEFAINTYGVLVSKGDLYLEYGETTDYGHTVVYPFRSFFGCSEDTELGFGLPNLQRNTTYHCRAVFKDWAGTTVGEDLTFTTLANLPPLIWDNYAPVKGPGPVPVWIDFWDGDQGENVTITSVSTPSHGSVVLGSTVQNAKFTYTPDGTFEDYDQFDVTVTDEHGASATATVYLANPHQVGSGRFIVSLIREGGPLAQGGQIALSVAAGGGLTGVLFFRGERLSFHGQFDEDGYFLTHLAPQSSRPIQVSLTYFPTRDGMKVGGWVTGRGDFNVPADSALTFPTDAPQAGYYTVSLQPGLSPIPRGDGFATGRVSARGRVGFVGRTGDGQAFSFGTQLRKGGTASFFVVAGPSGRDRLQGRFRFPGAGEMVCSGENVVWAKVPRTRGYYQEGFQEYLTVTGSRFEAPEGEDPVLDYTDTLLKLGIHFTDIDAEALFDAALVAAGSNESSLNLDGAATALSERAARGSLPRPPVKMKINRKRGTFSGTLRLGVRANQVKKFQGIILQHQNQGLGFVKLDAHGTGEVVVTPK